MSTAQTGIIAGVSDDDSAVTPHANAEGGAIGGVHKEEKVEYRDQDGNLLDEEQVAELKKDGRAKFETKYETKTRVIDEDGNVYEQPLAPEHPDVEGQNPDTRGVPETDANKKPADAKAGSSKKGEEGQKEAKPASDASEATK